MIVSNGALKRRHVYDVQLGGKNGNRLGHTSEVHQVDRVMYNGHQIWPDPQQMVAVVVLDGEGLKGSKDWAIWKTVREMHVQCPKDGWMRYMYLVDGIDGIGYDVDLHNKVEPHAQLCAYSYEVNGDDRLVFWDSDVRPGVGAVKAGDELRLCARFMGYNRDAHVFVKGDGSGQLDGGVAYSYEEHEGRFCVPWYGHDYGHDADDGVVSADWELPPWAGLVFHELSNKPKKRMKMKASWKVTTVPDGTQVVEHVTEIGGDKRGTWGSEHVLAFVKGATGMHVLGEQGRAGTNMKCWLEVLPIVDVVFTVKVKDVITCAVYE